MSLRTCTAIPASSSCLGNTSTSPSSVRSPTDPSRRAAHELGLFPIIRFVVDFVAISHHSHYIGKDGSGAVVLVGVEEDT